MVTEDDVAEAKERLSGIWLLWNQTGIIDSDDMNWILEYAKRYWTLALISDESWARNRTEIFTKDMEIEELKRQLKDALGN